MRAVLILACLAAVAVPAVWLFAGRQIVLLADRFLTAAAETLPTAPLTYQRGGFTIGDYSGSWLGIDGQPADIQVDSAADGRLVLKAGGTLFPLGIRLEPVGVPAGWPDTGLAPDPGDTVSLTRFQGRLAWPTWFETNFMTGQAPDRRCNLYYRLAWRKADGRELTMLWRWEQAHYRGDGWSPGQLDRLGATGLVEFRIGAAGAP